MRRSIKFLPLALPLVGALAILALLLTSGDQAKAAYIAPDPDAGQVADVSADMDTSGNGSAKVAVLGPLGVQSSISNIPVWESHDIDIVVDEIHQDDGSAGFGLNILYNPAVINITANDFATHFPPANACLDFLDEVAVGQAGVGQRGHLGNFLQGGLPALEGSSEPWIVQRRIEKVIG